VYREVPLSASCRKALAAWLTERRERVSEEERALFTGPQGRRLSSRAIDLVVRNVGERAGLALSAHVLRHTCVTNLVRNGNDLVLVAELARPTLPGRTAAGVVRRAARSSPVGRTAS
jgi:site-specific recombinase XerD